MNKSILFGEIDDCINCPFSYNNRDEWRSNFYCNGDPNRIGPCEDMEKWKDYTLEEIVYHINNLIMKREEYEDKMIRKEREKEEKKVE